MYNVLVATGASGAILTLLGIVSFVVGIWTEEADQFTYFFLGVGLILYGIWAVAQPELWYTVIGVVDVIVGFLNARAFVKTL